MRDKRGIYDENFDSRYLNKYGSLLAIGNGYIGIRGTHEESYFGQTRGMYVAGVYNKATADEPSELVNMPDITGMSIEIDEEPFSLLHGKIISYERALLFDSGEWRREIVWKSRKGARFKLLFQRFISKNDLHVTAAKVTITSLGQPASIKIITGIDAQQTNFGKQHLTEENIRVYEKDIIQGIYTTTQSGVTVALASGLLTPKGSTTAFTAKNRQILAAVTGEIATGEAFCLEKISTIFTSLDKEENPETKSLKSVKEMMEQTYDHLLHQSACSWREFWKRNRVTITSSQDFDQKAIDFALYHIEIMTPAHDERFSIGSKGLTGEGYKGHVFWDTEMFLFPFHLYSDPETAKKLLQYRYRNLQEAQEKAAKNGYNGALFPWESAFSGKEETPEFAAINIRTGTRQRVASAIAEHHIVADIAFAAVQYYENTYDENFMKKEGLALLMETAKFWISRTVEQDSKLIIQDVIGPDEYTEHVNNNMFTNYMAHYNVRNALYFMEKFQTVDVDLQKQGRDFLERLYLPIPNSDHIIPQDDSFLEKPEIDLTLYKKKQGSQAILLDYSRPEINGMQIIKQADVIMLLYLFPSLFSNEIVQKNLFYYEERTIHDSSLSKAIHAIVAARCNESDAAYRFFQEACLIDLGEEPSSSDEGIHGASLGAIWLAAVFGFANVEISHEKLALNPKLPKNWSELNIPFHFQGRRLAIRLTQKLCEITKLSGMDMIVEVNGKALKLRDKQTIILTD